MVAPNNYYKISLETELQRYPKIRVEDITLLQDWVSSQPHLPPISDIQISHFLYASYYDVEVAKNTIEHYFTYKNSMTEFFRDWDPQTKRTVDFVNKVIHAAFLPKQTPTDCQVILLRLNDPNVDLYSFNLSVKWLLMSVTRLVLEEGQQTEFKIVYDADGYTMSHVMKNPLSSIKHYLDFGQKASAIRVVEIHFINSSSVTKKFISLVKPFLNKHVMKMLNFHTSADGFFKTLQREQIPVEYGGEGPSIVTLHEENTKKVINMRDALMAHIEQRADETKRLVKKKKTKVEENFKNLEID